MEYQRGRGPILLRLLNDLLRRLPRSQSHSVILSGRILMLLSWVYPLNEKSGVNLRGNFNVGKGFSFAQDNETGGGEKDAAAGGASGQGDGKRGQESPKMEVEEGEEAEETKEGDASGAPNPLPFATRRDLDRGEGGLNLSRFLSLSLFCLVCYSQFGDVL